MRVPRVMLAAVLAAACLVGTTGGVFAYGRADQPLAQIELSANCTNASSPLCSLDNFGLGGIWLWVEIDQGGTGDVAGAGCQHLPGVFGGAEPIRGEIPGGWTYSTREDLPAGVIAVGTDPKDSYYLLSAFGFAFPVTTGHYSLTLDKGVFLQAQVAP
jgi:hypothetical protein